MKIGDYISIYILLSILFTCGRQPFYSSIPFFSLSFPFAQFFIDFIPLGCVCVYVWGPFFLLITSSNPAHSFLSPHPPTAGSFLSPLAAHRLGYYYSSVSHF